MDRQQTRLLVLESLEARICPSGGYLVVGSFDNNSVLRYDESTGAFVDQFDPHNLGNLKGPSGGVFGSDGNLYVSSGIFLNNNQKVLQYNGTTGEFQSAFASQNITSPRSVLFGPDGNLYVADGNDAASGDPASVERFDGKTGAFLNYFVAPSSGGLTHPSYMVFGPDGSNDGKLDLYVAVAAEKEVSSPHSGEILRYDGTTGAFLGTFVAPGSGGINSPQGMVFGTDGNLYVASGNWWASPEVFYKGDFPAGAILRFEGPTGPNPGAFLGTFVPGGSGGLANPNGIVFGPDPSGNGKTDLYVTSSALKSNGLNAAGGTSQVLRYDATTGAFLGTFVTPDSGGLRLPTFITFTETDPTTLNYGGAVSATASRLTSQSVAAASSLTPERLSAESALAVILAGSRDGGSFHGPYLVGVLGSAQASAATESLGGWAGQAYGFTVSTDGLGADSFNVGSDGAAFGVAINTMRNVCDLRKAVDRQAVNSVLYNGDKTVWNETNDLFDALNKAGAI